MADQPQDQQKVATSGDIRIAGRASVNVGAGATTPTVPHFLPRDVAAFTGREEELAQLAQLAQLASGGRVVVGAISGIAGVGKTALAVHAAHRFTQFPDGHLYLGLRGHTVGQAPVSPDEVTQAFLRSFGVPTQEVPAGTEERSGLLRQLLAERRVLMVLDDAQSEAQVRPLLPGAGGSLVLVTSRSALLGLEADVRISLNVLPQDEAVAMLARLIGSKRAAVEPEAVEEVARLCGRLPLALQIVGRQLAAPPAWSVATLAQTLTDEQQPLARLAAGDLTSEEWLRLPGLAREAQQVEYRVLAGGISADLVDPDRGIPKEEDDLEVSTYVAMMATAIARKDTKLPLSIGLFGEWGSGKSYFMGLLRKQVQELASSGDPAYYSGIVQIGFNAWSYADANLWASLGDEIFRELAGPTDEEEGAEERRRREELRIWLADEQGRVKELEAAKAAATAEVVKLRANSKDARMIARILP